MRGLCSDQHSPTAQVNTMMMMMMMIAVLYIHTYKTTHTYSILYTHARPHAKRSRLAGIHVDTQYALRSSSSPAQTAKTKSIRAYALANAYPALTLPQCGFSACFFLVSQVFAIPCFLFHFRRPFNLSALALPCWRQGGKKYIQYARILAEHRWSCLFLL